MKFNSGLLAGAAVLVAGVATAQDCISVALSAIPSCAQPCFLNGAPTIGCSGTDFKCQCQQQAKMFAAVESCVQKSCPESEFQKTIDGSDKVCTCASGGPASNNAGAPEIPSTRPASSQARRRLLLPPPPSQPRPEHRLADPRRCPLPPQTWPLWSAASWLVPWVVRFG
ncbi:hypothetical protein MCOR02_003636 [Pyricularia oryzae]|nr:hypothetical protein MCOR02_003636 [Pyricularia oryzae]